MMYVIPLDLERRVSVGVNEIMLQERDNCVRLLWKMIFTTTLSLARERESSLAL
jgi:hypothetical protein